MVQFYFVLGLVCLAAVALSGVSRPLKLSRWPRPALGAIGLALLGLGALLVAACGEPAPSAARISFDAFPDGTAVTGERILGGDEFVAAGILLAGAPEESYCAGATATAIRGSGRYGGISFYFLTTAMPDEIDKCNGVPVEITFTEPVRQVTLTFAGASQMYTLKAYDDEGKLLGSSETEAVFGGGTFEAAYSSKQADISRVTFGRPLALTAVKEISYER